MTVIMSPLHKKGIFTLTLIILAESATFSNASSFWKSNNNNNNNNNNGFFEQQQSEEKSSSLFFTSQKSAVVNEEVECNANNNISNNKKKSNNNNNNLMNKFNILAALPRTNRKSNNNNNNNNLLHPWKGNEECCRECYDCMDATKVAKICRGGHMHHSHSHDHNVEETITTAAAGLAVAVTPYNIPLHIWKVIFQAFLTALNVACWLLPLRSKKISDNKLAMSLANAFSGGVFLSLAFGHLIPECVHGFHNYNEATPFLLVLAGYLLIFFVEKVAFDAHDILHEMTGDDHHHHHEQPTTDVVRGGHAVHSNGTSNKENTTGAAASSGRSALILLGALAVHSILEMMALGLADTFGDCALLTVSISLHQPAESIALLVAFLKSGLTHKQIIQYLSIFSCMGPIGVLLGMLVNEYAAPIVDSIMLAVVAGTFVYVGATEVIPEEWEDSEHKWKKFFALMSGIISIFAITQYTMTLGH